MLDSEQLHEQAIRSARENGFIAYELAARFYAARGFEQIADLYLRNARYGYLRWGAVGKVRQLDETYLASDSKSHFPARRVLLVRRLNTSTSRR